MPDEILGEKVVMFIGKLHQNMLDFIELKTYLATFLKAYELPKQVVLLNEIYFTKSQKIDRIKSSQLVKF
jgi:non-ribosomal peptide synthetase component E (peptide arylation enzyme)